MSDMQHPAGPVSSMIKAEQRHIRVISIDPGVTTGLADWDATAAVFNAVKSIAMHQALLLVREIHAIFEGDVVVRLEDCRSLRMVGGENSKGAKAFGVLQGVGSVKRDCGIWDEFLSDLRIPWVSRLPVKQLCKWSASKFQLHTGWKERTNEHARDAAMAVYGLSYTQCRMLLIEAQQDMQKTQKR